MKYSVTIVGIIATLIFLGWLGLNIKPKPFPAFPQSTGTIETIPLPEGLPTPVERFYREVYGDNIPIFTSAVYSGRAMLRPGGPIYFPSRFRFTHNAGYDYRHYIEITLFGQAILKVNERFLEGKGFMDLGPIGTSEGANIDQAANLGLWAESVWLPAIWLTDSRVRWEAVDETTALLIVPYGETEEITVVRFDSQTGMLHYLEAMRYQQAEDESKVLWICEGLEWDDVNGYKLPTVGKITWFDQGSPWATFNIEEIVYNVDVAEYIQQRGP